jgi:MFS superfamily sulfate permease-like transporter
VHLRLLAATILSLPRTGVGGLTTKYVAALLPTVISMFVVILAQCAATSRAYAMKYNDSFDEIVDLVGLGAANFRARLTGTTPPPSRRR